MMGGITRREFLGKMAAGLALLTSGCSAKASWRAKGPEKGELRLVFYTDVHARTEWDTPVAMERAALAINAQKPALVIAGGDLITDGFQSSAATVAPRWDAYMKMHRAIAADVYPAIGNHDLVAANPKDGSPPAKDPRTVYLRHMGLDRTYYSFNASGYHFVVLDSILVTGDIYEYQGKIWPEQLEWLKEDLSSIPQGTPIVLVTHIPLLTSFFGATKGATFGAPGNRVVVNNLQVFKALGKHNLVLVLQGHLHVKELIRWKGTTFITGGAVSGKWWRGPYYGTKAGFNVIRLSGDHVAREYLDYGWKARRP